MRCVSIVVDMHDYDSGYRQIFAFIMVSVVFL